MISLIVALTADRVIGKENKMPWHLPADLAWFRKMTMGKPVIMGRRTWESIGRPLPGRQNIVISRQLAKTEGIIVATTPQNALASAGDAEEIMVIGGGHVYQQMLPYADRLYLTHVGGNIRGDTFFPDYHPHEWYTIFSESHVADGQHSHPYRFEIVTRKHQPDTR